MTIGFPRFTKQFASGGITTPLSDAQAAAGWSFLGSAPPTVEEFNAMMQTFDDKDNWLFNNIQTLVTTAGTAAPADNVFTALQTALDALYSRKTRGINASGATLIASTTGPLPAAAIGGSVILNAVIVAGLPASATTAVGARISFAAYIAGPGLQAAGGDSIILSAAGGSSSVTFGLNDTLTLENNGGGSWYAVDGSLHDKVPYDLRYAPIAGSATQAFSALKGTTANTVSVMSQVQNGARIVGLVAGNNGVTPLTKYDISCNSVTLREPSTGICYTVSTPAALTNDTGLAGPAANGRDGAGALAASQWVRLFYIYNPTTATLASISSAASPTAGPNLPAGYTAWAYIGSIYWNASSNFVLGNMRGARFQYATSVIALNAGTSTGLVAVPIPTLVPPECGWYELFLQQLTVTSGSGGSYSVNCAITTQAVSIFNMGLTGVATASQPFSFSGPTKQVTNFGQSFAYALSGSGIGMSATFYCTGYSLPNGGE